MEMQTQITHVQLQVCHLALEYTVPFLKMNSELMFGGLGKVVDVRTYTWYVCKQTFHPLTDLPALLDRPSRSHRTRVQAVPGRK